MFIAYTYMLIPISFCVFLRYRRFKRLLAEGKYVTGCLMAIEVVKENYIEKLTNARTVVVWFRDRHGLSRKYSSALLSNNAVTVCRQWIREGRSVGLLCLPDQNEAIITDLWLKEYR